MGRPGIGWTLLAAFAAASFAVFACDAIDAALNNRVFVGADGAFASDQLQYLAWATDSAHHGLIANLYGFHLGGHVFLHPVWLLTGVLHVDAGISYPLLLATWKVLAVAALVAAARTYVRSLLGTGRAGTFAAMAIALCLVSPSYLLLHPLPIDASISWLNNEEFSILWINGYFPTALAVAAITIGLVLVDRLMAERDVAYISRSGLLAGAAGCAAAWLHPWQGMTLLVVLAGLVTWERPRWDRHRRLIVPTLLTALPLLYYAALPHVDAAWAQSQRETAQSWTRVSPAALALTLLPVAILMLPGYAGPVTRSADRMLRLWPLAILVVYLVVPFDAFHAIAGVSIPAAVLIVRGWPRTRGLFGRIPRWLRRPLAVVALAVVAAGPAAALAGRIKGLRDPDQAAAQIARGEAAALDALARMPRGNVLTDATLGLWVPAIADDPVWLGHQTWTPGYRARGATADLIFHGGPALSAAVLARLLRQINPDYVLAPCGTATALQRPLAALRFRSLHFGCAVLYRRG